MSKETTNEKRRANRGQRKEKEQSKVAVNLCMDGRARGNKSKKRIKLFVNYVLAISHS